MVKFSIPNVDIFFLSIPHVDKLSIPHKYKRFCLYEKYAIFPHVV